MPFTSIQKYGATWPNEKEFSDEDKALGIEMACIRKGGRWKDKGGNECGEGLSFHYEQMRRILWPHLKSHRWHDLTRDIILSNRLVTIAGAGWTGKTHAAAWIFLCEYFCFPEQTCVLVSSTDLTGLKMRVWGEITKLWESAVSKFPFLPGHNIDSKMLIATDDLGDNEEDGTRSGRDWRKGIKAIPCMQNGRKEGLGKYVGIKAERLRLIADEAQYMQDTFLDALSNLANGPDFRGVILGNPLDLTDPLGKAAEPKEGWTRYMKPDKTTVWDTRFRNGKCINLVGTDSPNFDYPQDEPPRFPFLMNKQRIDETLSGTSRDSTIFYSQCLGVFQVGIMARRVIDRDMCIQFDAMKDVTWKNTELTRICALDSAYGGDRCIAGYADFGKDFNGDQIISIFPPIEVPIVVRTDMTPEDQISTYLKNYATENSIKPENFFHDSTGRGSLGTSLARIWSNLCNPVEFGGRPTKRPVSLDHQIEDQETRLTRPKRCDEHYDRFVSELAFSVRYVIEGRQMRNLPEEVMEEMAMRKWDFIRGNKISIEVKNGTSTKPGFKQRTGKSPDLADWLGIIIEGARQRGFEIKKLGSVHAEENEGDFFKAEAKRYKEAITSNLLQHTV